MRSESTQQKYHENVCLDSVYCSQKKKCLYFSWLGSVDLVNKVSKEKSTLEIYLGLNLLTLDHVVLGVAI